MDVVKFYNGMRDTTDGLPEWNALHPQHQQMIVQVTCCWVLCSIVV